MRVIIFSWEYPPRVVGQLSGYVNALSAQLANNELDVNVVTYDDSQRVERKNQAGVKTLESLTLCAITLAF